MKTNILHRDQSSKAEGLCVVIDVLRAFTTAAFAFAGGAHEIIMVSSIQEAFHKQKKDQSLILMGEEEGFPIEGFHYGNSPSEIMNATVNGKRFVQRTSSGTQGVIGCSHATGILVSSFVVADATIKRIKEINPPIVTFIVTGRKNGDEDLALAEYLQAQLTQKKLAPQPFLDRVSGSIAAERMISADLAIYSYGRQDLELAIQIDRFPFAMEVENRSGDLIARKVIPRFS